MLELKEVYGNINNGYNNATIIRCGITCSLQRYSSIHMELNSWNVASGNNTLSCTFWRTPPERYIWQQDVAAVKKQIVQLEENKNRAYALVIGQCLPDLDSKLQRSAAFVQAEASRRHETPPSHRRVFLPL